MSYKQPSDYLMYALTLITIVVIFALLSFIGIPELISLIIAVISGVILYKLASKKPKDKNKTKLQKVSSEKEEFYQSRGLSKEDITFFRETMQSAKEHILNIETNMDKASKLKAIAKRNNTVKISKSMFKSITNEPDRLHQVNQFLYVHLPSLDDLTSKYVEIKQHKAKSKATFDILEKSALTIDDMCEQITQDYMQFKANDLEDMDLNVKLAKQSLNNDNIDDIDEDITIDQDEI